MSWTDEEAYSHPAMDHVITGRRAMGRGAFTLKIRDAIIKDQGIFSALTKHVRGCKECDADKILWAYMNKQIRKGGRTSESTWKFVEIMSRAGKVNQDTIYAFISMTGRSDLFKPWLLVLPMRLKILGSALCVESRPSESDPKILAYAGIAPYIDYPDEELQSMVSMMEVHSS